MENHGVIPLNLVIKVDSFSLSFIRESILSRVSKVKGQVDRMCR